MYEIFFPVFYFSSKMKWTTKYETNLRKVLKWVYKTKKKHQVDVFNFCMDILIRFSLHAVSFVLKIPIKYFKLGFVLDFAFQAKIDCWIKNFCIFLKQPKKKTFYFLSIWFLWGSGITYSVWLNTIFESDLFNYSASNTSIDFKTLMFCFIENF